MARSMVCRVDGVEEKDEALKSQQLGNLLRPSPTHHGIEWNWFSRAPANEARPQTKVRSCAPSFLVFSHPLLCCHTAAVPRHRLPKKAISDHAAGSCVGYTLAQCTTLVRSRNLLAAFWTAGEHHIGAHGSRGHWSCMKGLPC